MNKLNLKAASPDNRLEHDKIIGLFRAVWGDEYPISSVYDPQFWAGHIGSRFTSILTLMDGAVVGHLAAQPDSLDPSVVQLLFPLSAGDDTGDDYILESAWKMFERQSVKQGWRSIYSFAFDNRPEMHTFAERVLGNVEVAVLPSYFTNSASGQNTTVSIYARTLDDFSEHQLYVPDSVRDGCKTLAARCGIRAEFPNGAPTVKHLHALPADSEAVTTEYFSKINVLQVWLEPSLIGDVKSIESRVDMSAARSVFLFVNASDPQAARVCDELSKRGFAFAGMLPFVKGRHSLVYIQESDALGVELDKLNPRCKEIFLMDGNRKSLTTRSRRSVAKAA